MRDTSYSPHRGMHKAGSVVGVLFEYGNWLT